MQSNPEQRLRGMLGFAMRAGRIVIGTESVFASLGKGRVRLVVYSFEASDGAKEKIVSKCGFYGVKTLEIQIDMGELGRLLGKTYGPACIAVTDEGFAREIEKCSTPEVTNERNSDCEAGIGG